MGKEGPSERRLKKMKGATLPQITDVASADTSDLRFIWDVGGCE